MSFGKQEKELYDAMVGYKVQGIVAAAESARNAGMGATDIIDALSKGMTEVGVQFERGRLFLPHVLSAAAGMQQAVKSLEKDLPKDAVGKKLASICMGTVEGDVHDIGKSICSTMLQCAGFDVHDLGRDVPITEFMKAIKEGGCTMAGLSALMTTTMTVQKEFIEVLKTEGIRKNIKVLVGGAPVTQAYAEKIGADYYSENASECVLRARDGVK